MFHLAFAQGRVQERRRNWKAAIRAYEQLLSRAGNSDPDVLFRLGHAYFRSGDNARAIRTITRAIILRNDVPEWHYRLGFVFEREHQYAQAIDSYSRALQLSPEREQWAKRLDGCRERLEQLRKEHLREVHQRVKDLEAKGLYGNALEILKSELAANPDVPSLLIDAAKCFESVHDYMDAASYYERAALLTSDPNSAYAAGYAYSQAGSNDHAERLFNTATRWEGGEAAQLGPGVYFQSKGLWREALCHYQRRLEQLPKSSELHFRIGMCHDRLYEWAAAEASYRQSLRLEPGKAYSYYRLGFVCERAGAYTKAIEAYTVASAFPEGDGYWKYRMGRCLMKAGQFQEACHAFISSEPKLAQIAAHQAASVAPFQPTDTNHFLSQQILGITAEGRSTQAKSLGLAAVQLGDYENAERAFSMLADCSPSHQPDAFFWLGYVRHQLRDYERAAESFTSMRLHPDPHGVRVDQYHRDRGLSEVMTYAELANSLPLRDDVVLYESGHGTSVSCNPLALFEAITRDAHRQHFWHVWVCNDIEKAPPHVRRHERVIFVKQGTYAYQRHLASARYLINNTSFPTYFHRRSGQKYLNTWHGTPLKTLGKDVKTGFFEHRNITRNLLQTTHLIAPNHHTLDILLGSHEVSGLYSGKAAITGYPRIDNTLNATPAETNEIRAELGISPQDNRPIVLYAPTWRGGIGSTHFDTEQLKNDIAALENGGSHVLFRAHRFAEALIRESGLSATIVPPHIDTNRLLTAVDLLVTDYSSIFFDYLPLRRPIVFYVPDLTAYEEQRGMYFKIEDMPGDICFSPDDLAATVQTLLDGAYREYRFTDAVTEFCPLEDGQASERAIAFFIDDAEDHTVEVVDDSKTTLLFRQSLIPNGITSSFVSLVSELDPERYRVVLLFDANSIESDPTRMRLFNRLPSHVHRIPRSGRQSFTAEEKWVEGKFASQGVLNNEEQMGVVKRLSQREFRRLFGDTTFDYVCEFDGYSRFWATLLAFGGQGVKRRLIYLHNEMAEEHRMKHPGLRGVFSLYGFYDSLVSVSESVMVANREALAKSLDIPVPRFVHADNVISPTNISLMALEEPPAELEEWLSGDGPVLMTVGRLSPEKGHERLLRSFSQLSEKHPETRLVIIGEGGLRQRLQNLIIELGLSSKVMMPGLLGNPFPVLSKADGFILPSLHEGQGLALIEAMVLGVPVVATDIPGPRSILVNQKGSLVPNSDEGVLLGLHKLAAKEVAPSSFNSEQYVENALSMFQSVLTGNPLAFS